MGSLGIGKPFDIVLIEDTPGDVRLTREVLKESEIIHKLHVIEDGIEALDYLHKKGKHLRKPRPDMILLDLNLPKKNGHEVLKEIKKDDKLKNIPVVILTISDSDDDKMKTYDNKAHTFITKPLELNQFINIAKSVEETWKRNGYNKLEFFT